ncbi:Catenin-beta-like protein [Lineolata rhizophorae]|uniref:Catenin-beta-like protein n=1 Tax=Lineolata rhizophorae TaxID=578093 RepID=A0A6A6NQ34_9PEZI|nr:Catenin-beta-like protein [Lineolata rhizophorae]
MASIDELFKKPNATNGKRKLDDPSATDPAQLYKSAKLSPNGDAKSGKRATVEPGAEEDGFGAEPPPDGDDGEDGDYGVAVPVDDNGDDEEGRFFGGGVDRDAADALDYLDSADGDQPFVPENVDVAWLRKSTLNFEKRISRNSELRGKFGDRPEKFMASEADLDAEIKSLSILSEHTDLYAKFAALGCAASLVGLLAHENTDIAIDAIEIIAELTDEDVEAEQDQWDALVNAMLDADLLSLLTSNFDRFDENQSEADRSGVYHSFHVFENLSSSSEIASTIATETSLLPFLLKRVQQPVASSSVLAQNTQYAAELLSILLSCTPVAATAFTKLSAEETPSLDILLQLLAPYRNRDPQPNTDESEYVENLFSCLAVLLRYPDGKRVFLEAEGVELALLMARAKHAPKVSRPRALQLLDHACGGPGENSAQICDRLVEAAGLKTLFGLFMRSKVDAHMTEHLLGILAALFRNLPGDSPGRIRVLAKFVEADYEKIKRLIELRKHYLSRLESSDVEFEAEYCLQMTDTILAWLAAEDGGARRWISDVLSRDGRNELEEIRKTLEAQLENMKAVIVEAEGTSDDDLDARSTMEMLGALISCL